MPFEAQARWEREQDQQYDEALERQEQEELRKEAEGLAKRSKDWGPEEIHAEQLLLFA